MSSGGKYFIHLLCTDSEVVISEIKSNFNVDNNSNHKRKHCAL